MKRITSWKAISSIAMVCFIILAVGSENCNECYGAEAMTGKLFICGLVIIAMSYYFASKYRKIETIIFDIENQPILETNEATDGVSFSCEGRITAPKTINSFFSKIPCVYYHYIEEKLVSSGKHSEWNVTDNRVARVPFFIEDERGKLRIDIRNIDSDFSKHDINLNDSTVKNPENSEIDCEMLYREKTFYKQAKKGFFSSRGPKCRYSEYILRPDINVFVHGYVKKIKDSLVLQEHERCPLIISRKPIEKYVGEFYKGREIIYVTHLMIFFGYFISLLALSLIFDIPQSIFYTIVFIGGVLIVGSVVFTMYNRIIKLKNRARNAESNIDGELQRRRDLIPNLVKVVEAYAGHEKQVLTNIAKLRTEKIKSPDIEYGSVHNVNNLDSTFFFLREKYPELKASKNFLSLQRAIVDAEERIAYSRIFYNRSVRKYNTLIQQFPFVIISILFKMQEIQFINLK